MLKPAQKRLLFLSSLGGVLEFFDFIIYALLADYIAEVFFPGEKQMLSLFVTFATFSIGYFVRPFGGILFGHFGDRYGRKTTFTISILIMALSTLGIGLVPTYAQIGIAAPVILLILRICQGLSVGGEIPGSIAYVSESMPKIKGLACGIIFFALLNGIVLGSLFKAILVTNLSATQMQTWGWRVPFFIGGGFGIISYFLRRSLEESALFRAVEHEREAYPVLGVLRMASRNTLAGIFVVGLGAGLITLLFLFMPAYLHKALNIKASDFIWFNTFAIFLSAALNIVVGFFSDKICRRRLLIFAACMCILGAYPIFHIYVHAFSYFSLALLLSAVLQGLVWGVIPSLLVDLFPTKIRYSGIAVSYNIGFAVFAGLTPLIAMGLVGILHHFMAPMYYFMGIAVLAIIALLCIKPVATDA